MEIRFILFIFIWLLLFCIGCNQSSLPIQNWSKSYSFASKSQTASLIIMDDGERFFKRIQPVDIGIQLKDNSLNINKDYMSIYKKHLQSSALDFTKTEIDGLDPIIIEIFDQLKTINPKLVVSISLCKIDVNHYGENVFYTRGNAIFIPKNVLDPIDKSSLKRILFHEMWHILSETFPSLKDELYQTIGFIKNPSKVIYPPQLRRRLLTNPDGVHDDYIMELEGKKVIPIIISKHEAFNNAIPEFMNYIQFELFNLNDKGEIETNADLTTTVNTDQYNAFFSKIKDNTDYIIHPDEIIADNFTLAITNDSKILSSDGKKLFLQVQSILKNFKY